MNNNKQPDIRSNVQPNDQPNDQPVSQSNAQSKDIPEFETILNSIYLQLDKLNENINIIVDKVDLLKLPEDEVKNLKLLDNDNIVNKDKDTSSVIGRLNIYDHRLYKYNNILSSVVGKLTKLVG